MKWRAEIALTAWLPALLAGCGATDQAGAPAEPRNMGRVAAFFPTSSVPGMPVKMVPHYEATGYASWYGDELRGRPTASGEPFDPDAISAAHPTLPLSSYIEVTALDTGRTIVARVNDRGPFSNNRLVDLSHGAARMLGISGTGHARVRIRRVQPGETRGAPEPRGHALAPPSGPAPDGVPRFVQIAAFASHGRANAMARRIGARVDRAGTVYRVRFGPFDDQAAAKQALREAGVKGYPDAQILLDSAPRHPLRPIERLR
ncbi:septal ring lytic transglycosylase RlpA family protein [Sphingomonas cavernae]|uniref:Endolytic peptidoglycan transglycosylase RlpA n=1 Tax=Sphingomonas cavernae TaxID=2320861 RepID=A0A418WMA0_9SPHN|nr:SPOR domain-containing protein [Sphingomonas cavernae]RJF91120.1 septal ring lytic transglycosylase RlpA family protein [Sphingomonas cavernae]